MNAPFVKNIDVIFYDSFYEVEHLLSGYGLVYLYKYKFQSVNVLGKPQK